jgi:hypothetical protein
MMRVAPSELFELEKSGTVSDSLRPYAAQAIEEADGFARALGGVDVLSEQRLALIQDTARVGLVMRAVVARFLQGDGDPELASKIGTLASTRRSLLSTLGLDRMEREVPDLRAYLEQHDQEAQTRAHEANGDDPGASPAQEDEEGRKAPVESR